MRDHACPDRLDAVTHTGCELDVFSVSRAFGLNCSFFQHYASNDRVDAITADKNVSDGLSAVGEVQVDRVRFIMGVRGETLLKMRGDDFRIEMLGKYFLKSSSMEADSTDLRERRQSAV